ncbi:MAG TPA: hypothetical protein PKC18_15155, partial [Lacipirellulaceae bacterium]|nr:hypothetical protein [Lacipirellulaceae bacterium]
MPGRLSRWGIRQPAIAPDGLPNVPPTTPPILAYSDPSSDVGASGLDSVRLGALANSEARTSEGRSFWRASFAWSAWLASTIVHCSLLIALSMLLLVAPRDDLLWLSGVSAPQLADEWDVELDESPLDETAPSLGAVPAVDSLALPGPTAESVGSLRTGPEASGISFDGGSAPLDPLAPVGETAAGAFAADMAALSSPLTTRGGGLQGRQLENRLALALSGGGTRESEEAVERGLAWLAEHQFEDGSWRFDLQSHPQCAGYCRDSGTYKSRTAATGLALLSFLGAGYTHQQGPYQDQVLRGLYYLTERMAITSHGGDLRDSGSDLQAQIERGLAGGGALPVFRRDTMYSHAIASLAITDKADGSPVTDA